MSNIYDYINNIYVYGKNFGNIIGILSNQGANPQAPYYDDLFVQELDTGADTFQFTTVSTPYTQDFLEIGNHVGFHYNNRFEYFTITSLEYSHYEGYKTIGVYAEGIGFELLDIFMERPKTADGEEYPGRDNDNDGDDNNDDEYADVDDVYVDENGIIIYDKNGGDYANPDDVYVDKDGIIVYKPSRNKKKNDDSIEFKNISYPTFLNILLKNTGWKIECQPGLESVKHNISVRYDTNIYAILQDSMQAYKGVELEFVLEGISKKGSASGYYYSDVKKIVKAYKNGGRGSFVGKRFEYGTNVKGITKTQKVVEDKEDSVIYIDDIGVDVQYDIDFALKSAEIPEIEIGDTHYVIDRDFCPPMTIKARIGKIEVSFSDLTKNKLYVANSKKIRGSVIDDEDVESIVKNLDDKIIDTIIDDGIIDDTITDDYIRDIVDDVISGGDFGDCGLVPDVFEVVNGVLHVKLPVGFENSANFLMCSVGGSDKANLIGIGDLECCVIRHTYGGTIKIDGDLEVTGNIISSNTASTVSNETEINATIGALQEEVRMRDDKIASLEARLAAIEEMLNNK